jgi:hypothetical protein
MKRVLVSRSGEVRRLLPGSEIDAVELPPVALLAALHGECRVGLKSLWQARLAADKFVG